MYIAKIRYRKKKLCLKYDKLFASNCALIINNFFSFSSTLLAVNRKKKSLKNSVKLHTTPFVYFVKVVVVCAFMFANGSSLFINDSVRAIFFFLSLSPIFAGHKSVENMMEFPFFDKTYCKKERKKNPVVLTFTLDEMFAARCLFSI